MNYLKKNWKALLMGAAIGAGASQGIPPDKTEIIVNILLSLIGA